MGAESKSPWVLPFSSIGEAEVPLVGGKAGSLGALRSAGLPVPDGFCVTTAAFRDALAGDPAFTALLDRLDEVKAGELATARTVGAALREHVSGRGMPEAMRSAILEAFSVVGEGHAYAVRSSATAEDLPHASFAGQQDTYLNVRGPEALLAQVRACWASLYTDRAILYRIEQGIPHRDVALCVIVQRLVQAEKAGILFTAHPITGHRQRMSIEAGWGLGEALVSGIVSPDRYTVDRRDGRVVEVACGEKLVAIRSVAGGGTETQTLSEAEQRARVLDERELSELTALGARVEALRGCPQDIEWAIAEGTLFLLQARPITSLFPLPSPAPEDGFGHLYMSFNHFQVMTDAMPPMALHVWQLALPFGRTPGEVRESPWASHAGGRVYVDLSYALRSRVVSRAVTTALGAADRLVQAAVREAGARPELSPGSGPAVSTRKFLGHIVPVAGAAVGWMFFRPTSGAISHLTGWLEAEAEAGRLALLNEAPLAERVRTARALMALRIYPLIRKVPPMVLAGIAAGRLLRVLVEGPEEDFVALGRGLSGNVTTEMDLAVGDLADLAREHPAVAARLVEGGATVETLRGVEGGEAFLGGLDAFLDRYGARGPSEIDLSRPRYRDAPGSILAVVAGNLRTAKQMSDAEVVEDSGRGAHRAHHARLAREAEMAAGRLLETARRGLLGKVKVPLVRRLIGTHRDLVAAREHPKLLLIKTLDAVRHLVLSAGAGLVAAGRLERADDVFFLDLHELEAALRHPEEPLRERVASRREALARFQELSPPRVMTEQGEIVTAKHAEGSAPRGALVGSPASSGIVEGLARVVLDPAVEVLERGEILVAPFTDPGWTPLFVNAAGLVMEVGGMMTHGSVVAREYGIPAVVCVPGATRAIRTGQRIRVHGDGGYVEILEGPAASA
ncbi:phosphoenolpyruvate synthase [Chondromyces crocatus]|uniref:Phosphoenolpyruvate synthase n=1 Tax=Chondromyces crocatus TaxID=52 RepID=A0A0K1ERP8_CHOCO|nr:phosphoenolpyruvate synthase [Chondromyces crocatus]AKT43293.1 phosphoenolpyruvate synthase [Chondromyces crocatus]